METAKSVKLAHMFEISNTNLQNVLEGCWVRATSRHRAVRTINIARRVLISPEGTNRLRSSWLTGDLDRGALRCTDLLMQSKRPDPFDVSRLMFLLGNGPRTRRHPIATCSMLIQREGALIQSSNSRTIERFEPSTSQGEFSFRRTRPIVFGHRG